MKLATLALIAALLVLAGCTMPTKQMLTEDGKPIFIGPDNKATLEPVNPATNEPNAPLLETDVEKVEGIATAAKEAGSKLPEPFGLIVGGLLGIAGTTGLNALRKKRDAARAKAKAELDAKKEPVVAT